MERIQELVAAAFKARAKAYGIRKAAAADRFRTESLFDRHDRDAIREHSNAEAAQAEAERCSKSASTDRLFAEAHGDDASANKSAAQKTATRTAEIAQAQRREAKAQLDKIPKAHPEDRGAITEKVNALNTLADKMSKEAKAWGKEVEEWQAVEAYLDGGEAQ